MIHFPEKSMTENNKVYFEDYLHIKKSKFNGLQRFGNVVRTIEIKLRILE